MQERYSGKVYPGEDITAIVTTSSWGFEVLSACLSGRPPASVQCPLLEPGSRMPWFQWKPESDPMPSYMTKNWESWRLCCQPVRHGTTIMFGHSQTGRTVQAYRGSISRGLWQAELPSGRRKFVGDSKIECDGTWHMGNGMTRMTTCVE